MKSKRSKTSNMDYWKTRILLTSWFTYGSFYLCRVNIAIVLPLLVQVFGFSNTALGGVISAFLVMYCIGQFLSGYLGDKVSPRLLIFGGILGSVFCNVLFVFTRSLVVMLILWGMNGLFQSTGWAPTIKVVTAWFQQKEMGKVGGVMGSSFLVGTIYAWFVAAIGSTFFGWRGVFWLPALLLLLAGVHWYLRIQNTPEDLPTYQQQKDVSQKEAYSSIQPSKMQQAFPPIVWCSAIGLLFMNFVRYGIINWIPTFLSSTQSFNLSTTALNASLLPLGGILGVFSASWLSTLIFQNKKGPIAIIYGSLLTCTLLLFILFPLHRTGRAMCFILVGFAYNGSNILLTGLIPTDVKENHVSTAAGFIDGFGYIGSIFSGVYVGYLLDVSGWVYVFYTWIIAGALFVVAMMILTILEKSS